VVRQRRAQERRSSGGSAQAAQGSPPANGKIGPTDMLMPSGTGVVIKKNAELAGAPVHAGHPHGPVGGHPGGMHAMTKGCLAGSGVCFISFEGSVYPCGYLPVAAGDLKKQTFPEVWEKSGVFRLLRDSANLKGKCGCCEFRNVCMGCRARAYAATGDMLQEEPFCIYQPRRAKDL
jgi:radical SAM protein with 4Fe4S-binding SPASM domain